MSRSRKAGHAAIPLDAEITAMLDRVRQVFGDEVLARLYERARNAAIRQSRSFTAPLAAGENADGKLRLVAASDDEGFVRALREELDRALTHH